MTRFDKMTTEDMKLQLINMELEDIIEKIDAAETWDMELIRELAWRADVDLDDGDRFPDPDACYAAAIDALREKGALA